MQNPKIQLREIIYEITDNCHQACSYCGSKDILNKTKVDIDKIQKIVNNIASYPPKEINVSGGNPFLAPLVSHEHLVNKLKQQDVVCKLIMNPYNHNMALYDSEAVMALYDWIGISINTLADMKKFAEEFKDKSKFTVITNFNTENVFIFKDIERFVQMHNLTWQIQYTMYKDENEKAIYQNEEANKYFINLANSSNANIIKADNFNCGDCSAGIYSLGILADGSVIPCLSMRAWHEDVTKTVFMGNLLEENMFNIWVKNFAEWRCGSFTCCKDITKIMEQKSSIKDLPNLLKKLPLEQNEQNDQMTFLYGVIKPPQKVKPYPEWNTNQVMVYGVFNNDTKIT